MSCYITDYNIPGAEVALEDSIMQKGYPVTAGSRMLENFISPLDATVVTRLVDNKITIAGKTKMGEFGISDISALTSGETSGAVRAVAEGAVSFALCNDVFGKYRYDAAETGMCYIHPTYGTVSRFGLIPLASSMDQIGVVCKNLMDGFGLLSLIAGKDENDGAMFPNESYTYGKTDKEITVALPNNFKSDFAANFNNVSIELEYFDVYKQVMYILSCAEISNNINRYDGIKFGYRADNYNGVDDLYIKTRTAGFGLPTKLAAIMGSMALSHNYYHPYYEKAMKIRRLIKESLRFDNYDVIALPLTTGGNYDSLSLYALSALAGLPSVSFSYKGAGVQLIANVKNENALLKAWEVV